MPFQKQTAGHQKSGENVRMAVQSTQETPRFDGEDVAFIATGESGGSSAFAKG